MTQTGIGYEEAVRAIAAGHAKGKALWVLLSDERERDGHALRPSPWEGSGEYQRVSFDDGRDGFVRVPTGRRSLPVGEPWGRDDAALIEARRLVASLSKAERQP